MHTILRFFATFAVAAATPLLAQEGRHNTVITGVDGVPWGASRAQVEARFGIPDSVLVRGDTVNLTYLNQSILGKAARMLDIIILPQDGLAGAAYMIQQSPGDCVAGFEAARAAIMTSHAGLRVEPRELIFDRISSTDPGVACRLFTERNGVRVLASQYLRDPVGPGAVWLFSLGTYSQGTSLVIDFQAAHTGSWKISDPRASRGRSPR